MGKENYNNKENHKHKIEKIYFININGDNPQIQPKKIYSVTSTAIKRESTISPSSFNNWTRHAEKCEICESPITPESDYWQKNA